MMNQIHALHAYWCQRHWRRMLKHAEADSSAVASAMQSVPQELRWHWERYGPNEFPGMATTDRAWAWSLRGLLTYFAIAAQSPKQTLLPSRAADSIWHAWLAWDAEHLARFQRRHFGKTMPHVAKEDMPASTDASGDLPRTWALASAFEGTPVLSGTVPFVFQVDKALNMPTGWHYAHDRKTRRVRVADIGAMAESRLVPGLTATGLLALGLVSAHEAQAWQTRNAQSSASGSSSSGCGVGMPGFSCGSSSSDGGDDAGGGDGGGCGGGCG